ncbi:MAG: hypothetical protein BGO01_17470 [Armatimonadetes bacterium 55-13]|nr:sugar phosphate isomerase/epimerase [Armatimonadota bacterium]ODU53498.1 MAG: hypothetical protein ABT09_01715 [bacterium SCN 57-13]OJU63935.1 MAG: hypothetical protein BGO01_17470 [Armatimonadetes bacterium 55-13]
MRLSVQLYTLRNPLGENFAGTLKALKAIGFEYVELAGYNGLSPAEVKKILDDNGLKVSGAHYGLDALKDVDAIVADSHTLGNENVILPWISEEQYKNGWVEFAMELEPLARAYQDKGLTFSYHNHAFEFENPVPSTFAEMWDKTEPDLIQAQLDLGWITVAGEDPVAWIEKLGKRVSSVHLKDYSGNRERHDIEAGKGVINWEPILQKCEELGVPFGSIEMDNTPDEPITSVRRSAEYFFGKGLK